MTFPFHSLVRTFSRGAVLKPGASEAPSLPHLPVPDDTSLFHVTHWKAGSQWIRRILETAFGPAIVTPDDYERQLIEQPIRSGAVYPCVYLSEAEFSSLQFPDKRRTVVVIRDLRDTLISAYFSVKFSHVASTPWLVKQRLVLHRVNLEEGLLYLMDRWLPHSAAIQRSWLDSDAPWFRFEDLLRNPAAGIEDVFRSLDVFAPSPYVEKIVSKHSFEKLSGGRKPGEEEQGSHYRNGVSGNWREYFTSTVSDRFKRTYGDVLVRAGYERSENW